MPLSLTRTADGGFAVVSHTKSTFSSPMRWLKMGEEVGLVSKHSSDGQLQWAKMLAPGGELIANPVVSLDGGIAVAGATFLEKRWTGFLSRLSDSGEVLWGRLLGRDFEVGITWITPDEHNGLWAIGPRQLEGRPGVSLLDLTFQIWVARLGGDGTVAWSKTYSLPRQSGLSAAIAAPPSGGGGLLVIRQSRYDRKGDLSHFPIIELDAQGEVLWAVEYELEGDGGVTAILPTSSGGYLLFGPTSPTRGQGGFFTIEIGPKGQIVSSTWIDIAAALTTPERTATTPPDPVSAVRDPDGRIVVMGDSFSLPARMMAEAKPPPPAGLKEELKGTIYLARTGADGQVQGCSLPLRLVSRPIVVSGEQFDLAAREMPLPGPQDVSKDKLDIRRLEAR